MSKVGARIPRLAALALIAFGLFSLTHSGTANAQPAQANVAITVGDKWFCDPSFEGGVCSTSISVGDTVVWEWGPGGSGTGKPHTSTNCADNFTTCGGPREWDSANLSQTSGTFSHSFGPEDASKTFLYRCQIHPNDMRGQIVVQAVPTPTSVPPPPSPTSGQPTGGQTPTPAPTSAATPSPVSTDAPSPTPSAAKGSAPDGDGSVSAWWLALIGIPGGLALIAGTLFIRRRYRP